MLLLWSFHSVSSLPITKGPQRAAESPPRVAATSAPPLPSPHLPSWGAKITLKRPASLCRLSSCHLKEKKKKKRRGRPESWRKEIPSGLTLFKFARATKKRKKEKRRRSGRSLTPPNPGGTETCRSESQRRAERVLCPTMLTRPRAKTGDVRRRLQSQETRRARRNPS